MGAILDIRNLTTEFNTSRGTLTVVDDVSLQLAEGECLGIVGESGSGKSVTCRSVLGLVSPPGRTIAGEVLFDAQDLRALSEPALNRIRGQQISVIVQDAVAALNPVMRIGDQICEPMLEHGVASNRAQARRSAVELMRKVGIPSPEKRIDDYPHQVSGGMCQRVVIATALACSPRVIIADEPTTALDVTVQDQILKLLVALQRDLGLSIILVTHDMGVVAQTCQRVAVMYAGQIVETAATKSLFAQPRHPYTTGLLNCLPRLDTDASTSVLRPIPGMPPDLADPPSGCRFHPRCPLATDACRSGEFTLREVAPDHHSSCIRQEALSATDDIWALADANESRAEQRA